MREEEERSLQVLSPSLVPCPGDYGIRIIWGGGGEEGKRALAEMIIRELGQRGLADKQRG